MKFSKLAAIFLVGYLSIIGCGDTTDNSDTNSSELKVGTFVDAPVAGLTYETSSGVKGITDEEGHFKYNEGDTIVFELGNNKSDAVKAGNVITPFNLSDGNETIATNIAYVFQNLDTDGDAYNNVIKLPSNEVLKDTLPYINFSDEKNVTQTIEQVKPLLEQKLGVVFPDVNITESKTLLFTQVDNIIKSLIVGKTYYIPVLDTENPHVETLHFNEDGTITDSWIEEGKEYKTTINYKIENGKIIIWGEDTDGNEFNYEYTLDDFQEEFYTSYEEAYQHLNTNSDVRYFVSDLVSGKVTFTDEEGNIISVLEDAKIRITPKRYQIDGDWQGVNCKIEEDGSFGKECYIEINESDMKEALENEPVQIVVYKDSNNDYYWEADEPSYFYEENVTLTDLKNIQINVSINENTIQNDSITLDKFKEILSEKGLTPINYNLSGKTIAGAKNDSDEYNIVYFNNSFFQYYIYNQESFKLEDSGKHNYTINDGIYVVNNDSDFAIVSKIQDVITVVGYNPKKGFWQEKFLVLNGDATNTKITSSNIKNFFPDTDFVNITDSDIEGTWISDDDEKIVFNNGQFSFTWLKNGEDDGEGTYKINNGVIELDWNDGSAISYVLPAELNNNQLKVYVIQTDVNGDLRGAEIHTLTKQ